MKKSEYVTPLVFAIVTLGLTLYFAEAIKGILVTKTFSSEFFSAATTLFGLSLTAYAILFGLLPALRHDFKESSTLREINTYFKFCLFVLLLQMVLSTLYLLMSDFVLFVLNITLLGFTIGVFYEIITLLFVLFDFAGKTTKKE